MFVELPLPAFDNLTFVCHDAPMLIPAHLFSAFAGCVELVRECPVILRPNTPLPPDGENGVCCSRFFHVQHYRSRCLLFPLHSNIPRQIYRSVDSLLRSRSCSQLQKWWLLSLSRRAGSSTSFSGNACAHVQIRHPVTLTAIGHTEVGVNAAHCCWQIVLGAV